MRGCESKFGHGLFLLTEGLYRVWKFRFMKTWPRKWKADFKVNALHKDKVATQSSVVKSWYLDCTIVLQFVAAQGCLGCGHLRGRVSDYRSSHRENMTCCSMIIGSCLEVVAVITVVRFIFMNFHEFSFFFFNFHEFEVMKLCNFESIALQWTTGAMRLSFVKSWSFSCLSFFNSLL